MNRLLPTTFIRILLLIACLAGHVFAQPHGPLSIAHFNNPRDFTLRITDPYPPENRDLIQPVLGNYTIQVLPYHISEEDANSKKYACKGLYFKQVGEIIYVDVRVPPVQEQGGLYDLSVTLSLPVEGDFFTRQKRAIRYEDAKTDVVLLLDNSASMKDNDPRGQRYVAAENFIHLASLSNKINRLAVVKFSSVAKVVQSWSDPGKISGASKLESMSRTGNFTNFDRALEAASDLFMDSSASDKIAILLSDGRNEPGVYRNTHKVLLEQGVQVICVALSSHADRELMGRIALETGGSFFSATDDAFLLQIYNQIASEIGDIKTLADGHADGENLNFDVTDSDEVVNLNLYGYALGSSFTLYDPAVGRHGMSPHLCSCTRGT
ncbi:MAG: VWA domain-containing protein, partial [Planctomycetes bacterium]|nr:VWA domain-containing protein [Planctomycetota bacterium]